MGIGWIARMRTRAKRLNAETYALYLAIRHPLTPWYARGIAIAVVAYAFSPIDLIPDFIPILGYLDDLVIVPIGVALAIRMIPRGVIAECRERSAADFEGVKRAGKIAAIFIVAVWVVVITAIVVWIVRATRQ